MICSQKRLRLCRGLIVCCLVFIWGNSLLPGAISQAVSDGLKQLMGLPLSAGVQASGRDLVRKLAHFTEYAALGWLLGWRVAMGGKKPVLALILGALCACLDETIQIFAPDRGPGLADVLLDSFGVLAGIFALHLGHTVFKTIYKKHLEDQEQ